MLSSRNLKRLRTAVGSQENTNGIVSNDKVFPTMEAQYGKEIPLLSSVSVVKTAM
jgi:hypothetical protein